MWTKNKQVGKSQNHWGFCDSCLHFLKYVAFLWKPIVSVSGWPENWPIIRRPVFRCKNHFPNNLAILSYMEVPKINRPDRYYCFFEEIVQTKQSQEWFSKTCVYSNFKTIPQTLNLLREKVDWESPLKSIPGISVVRKSQGRNFQRA